MANPKHLDILRQGVDVWNRWREENPGIQPDLAEADLSMMDFRDVDLSGVTLTFANLHEAKNLCKAKNLREADLRSAYLREVDLRGVDLRWANLGEAELSMADLRGANLTDADLNGALLDRANLAQVTGLTQDQINEAWGDQDTELPEGLQRPAHWLEELERKPLFLRAVSFMASLFSRRGSGRASVG